MEQKRLRKESIKVIKATKMVKKVVKKPKPIVVEEEAEEVVEVSS